MAVTTLSLPLPAFLLQAHFPGTGHHVSAPNTCSGPVRSTGFSLPVQPPACPRSCESRPVPRLLIRVLAGGILVACSLPETPSPASSAPTSLDTTMEGILQKSCANSSLNKAQQFRQALIQTITGVHLCGSQISANKNALGSLESCLQCCLAGLGDSTHFRSRAGMPWLPMATQLCQSASICKCVWA